MIHTSSLNASSFSTHTPNSGYTGLFLVDDFVSYLHISVVEQSAFEKGTLEKEAYRTGDLYMKKRGVKKQDKVHERG